MHQPLSCARSRTDLRKGAAAGRTWTAWVESKRSKLGRLTVKASPRVPSVVALTKECPRQSSLLRLKAWHSELPQQERKFVGQFRLALRLGRTHAVASIVIHAQKYRLAAICRGLQPCCHFRCLPGRDS